VIINPQVAGSSPARGASFFKEIIRKYSNLENVEDTLQEECPVFSNFTELYPGIGCVAWF